jgi:uroporphyrinogen-III synthase
MKRILLTRENSKEDVEFFTRLGFSCEILPLSELVVRELTEFERAILAESDWIFFTSQTPVKMILSVLSVKIKIACIGEKTAQAVRACGFEPDFVASQSTRTEMIEQWQQQFSGAVQIFYPMSNLAQPLEISGVQVKNVVCYENRLPEHALTALSERFLSKTHEKISAVYLTSPSAWYRFQSVYEKMSFSLELIAIGKTTQRAIEKSGYSAILKKDLKEDL